jgi:hypothetical protein
MEDSEKNRYIEFLIQQKEERDRTIADKDAFIKNLQNTLDILKSMNCEKPSDPLDLPAEKTMSPCPEKEERPNRQGMNYDTMQASRRIGSLPYLHCNLSDDGNVCIEIF